MNKLFAPIFSMRSYETGQYAILKDGNFQLTFSRLLHAAEQEPEDLFYIAVPEDASDLRAFTELPAYKDSINIILMQFKYGFNAVDTREKFWDLNAELMEELQETVDLLVTDITGYSGRIPVIFNFNITKLPELDRPYIDQFFETDLKSIERSLHTTVLNPRQREYILEVRPDLADKVVVNTLCLHPRLAPIPGRLPEALEPIAQSFIDQRVIFWPFRISDKAYQFETFMSIFKDFGLQQYFKLVITDPNDTLGEVPDYVIKYKPTKEEYYSILKCKPLIVMLDDIDTVLHPGTIEFFYYGCPTITFEAELLKNPNSITSLEQLPKRLFDPSQESTDISNFVF